MQKHILRKIQVTKQKQKSKTKQNDSVTYCDEHGRVVEESAALEERWRELSEKLIRYPKGQGERAFATS